MNATKLRQRLSSSRAFNYLLRRWRDYACSRNLRCVQMRINRAHHCVLFCAVGEQDSRMDFFYEYYRALGVDHFIFIDIGSFDGFAAWFADKPDISVWSSRRGCRNASWSTPCLNFLLSKYGSGRLCVTVDTNEFLVFPHMETRGLKDLGGYMKEIKQPVLGALQLDFYAKDTSARRESGLDADPLELYPYFDRDGYVQRRNHRSATVIQGGPTLRLANRHTPGDAPALNKIPVVWWKPHYRYEKSTHEMWPWSLNRMLFRGKVPLSAGLMRFDWAEKLGAEADGVPRTEGYGKRGRGYHQDDMPSGEQPYQEGVSIRYENSDQLVALGLMNTGEWN